MKNITENITVLNVAQDSSAERLLDETRSFDAVATAFPELVKEIHRDESPRWGSAFYAKGEKGVLVLWAEHWDSSG